MSLLVLGDQTQRTRMLWPLLFTIIEALFTLLDFIIYRSGLQITAYIIIDVIMSSEHSRSKHLMQNYIKVTQTTNKTNNI